MIRLIVIVAVMVAGLIFGPRSLRQQGLCAHLAGQLHGGILGHQRGDPGGAVLRRPAHRGMGAGPPVRPAPQDPGLVRPCRRRKANLQTVNATLAMAEGHYNQAEKLLIKGADNSDTPLLNYLSAAQVAQARDDVPRITTLQKAQEENPKAELALDLIQTQCRLSRATTAPRSPRVHLCPQPAPPHGAGSAASGVSGP